MEGLFWTGVFRFFVVETGAGTWLSDTLRFFFPFEGAPTGRGGTEDAFCNETGGRGVGPLDGFDGEEGLLELGWETGPEVAESNSEVHFSMPFDRCA